MSEVEEIKARLDIVDVIGQYVPLQRAGRSFKAPCPFHNEKTPSFIVTPERQTWHCFGACGTGGDVIAFVMKKDGLDFPEALRILAERAGVPLRERRVSEREDRERDRLYSANEAAAEWFRELLRTDVGNTAREYVERRGIDAAAADSFLIGYSAQAWESTRGYLNERGFSDQELLRAGLLVMGDQGSPYDRFRGRLMFPIRNAKGRVVGFGARALDESMPKYLNTPQTPIFDKGSVLYALERAEAGIRRERRAVIVEGYMDVIAAHQHGFDDVVASMGTALTERQVRTLKRLARDLVLALDADAAGSEAAIRGHDVVREAAADPDRATPVISWRGLVGYQQAVEVELKVAVLPEGKDPDDVIRADPAAWRTLIDGAKPVLEHRMDAAAAANDLATPGGRSQFVQQYLPLLASVTDPVVRAHYLQRVSRLALADERELSRMFGGTKEQLRQQRAQPASSAAVRRDPREEYLLSLLFQYSELRREGQDIASNLLWESENRELLAAWQTADASVEDVLEGLKTSLPDALQPHLERLLLRNLPDFNLKEAREALQDCRARLQRRQVEAEKLASSALLASREEEVGVAALVGAEDREEVDDERIKEAVGIHIRDMETGLRLHGTRTNG